MYIDILVTLDVLKLVAPQISLDLPLATLEGDSLQNNAGPVLGFEESNAAAEKGDRQKTVGSMITPKPFSTQQPGLFFFWSSHCLAWEPMSRETYMLTPG